jgi:lysophosphatidate acyltransferase
VILSNTVFIDRSNHKSALVAFDSAAKHMQEGKQSVFIFPEGTRSYYSKPDMLPFKKGAFHLAVKAQVPIVPVVCANYSKIVSVQEKRFIPGRIPVKVLKPIPTTGLGAEDVDDLMRYVREAMLEALKELHVTTPPEYAYTNGSATAPELKEKVKLAVAS